MMPRNVAGTLFLFVCTLLIMSGTPAFGTTVLLIGNSHLMWNDLPATLTGLADAGGHTVTVASSTVGSSTISYHTHYQPTLDMINSQHWDYVLVQEHSILPVIPYWTENSFYPMAARMDSIITAAGSEMTLFMHWARQNPSESYCIEDHCSRTFTDYFDMQQEMSAPYWPLANDLDVGLIPAGDVWAAALADYPLMPLWDTDGLHPSIHGTYFAGCIIYAYIFNESPEGLNYYGGLSVGSAQAYQRNSWPLPEPEALCEVDPVLLDFGTVTVGNQRDASFTITNISNGTLDGVVSETCDQYSLVLGGGAYSLDAEDSLVVTVRFEPTTLGAHDCTIETGLEDCAEVACTGTGRAAGSTSGGPVNLLSSYPNPFRLSTQIRFELIEQVRVAIDIFDAAGRLVRNLSPGTVMDEGPHDLAWDGRDDSGIALPAGVYVVRLGAEGGSWSDRVTLIK